MPPRDHTPTGAPCWIELFTSDPEAATAFYRELFGWTAEEPDEDLGGYFNFRKDGQRIAGGMRNDGRSGSPDMWSVYLATDDAKRTADAAVANGGQVFAPAHAVGDLGAMAVLADTGGATIGAWQPGTHPGFQVLGEPGAPSWFELHTGDYDAAVAFYQTVFGWDANQTDEPGFRYTTLGEGEDPVAGMAGIMDAAVFGPEGGAPPGWSVYFNVADPDAALERVVELGGAVVRDAEDTPFGRMGTAADPTGILFKLVKPS